MTMISHREPIAPGQPEPGELPVEPDNGPGLPAGLPLDDEPSQAPGPVAPV